MNIIVLVVVFFIMLFLKSSTLVPWSNPNFSPSVSLGFILIFAFLVGKTVNRFKLPQITGFILAGIFCGPYILKLLSTGDVENLQLLDGLALSLIALTAGGEMRIADLRKNMRAISSILIFQTVIIIAGFVIFGLLGRSFFPFFSEKTVAQGFALSLLLGTLATATSPSTTIAVITETKAKGKYTDLILSTAVIKDFLVIIIFALSLSLSKFLAVSGEAFEGNVMTVVLRDVGGSVLLGGLVGLGIVLYLKFINRETAVFILGVAFFTFQISPSLRLHPLLICLVAGFFVENFSSRGDSLIQAIEKVSVPIYVIFFAISGASLNLEALRRSWVLALIFVAWRGILKFSGTYVGAKIVKEDPGVQKRSWAGFISQAGVTLGMAVIVERAFPEWGGEFKALVLAVIAINQIIGPILLQRLLFKVGEAGKKQLDN
jgi:Kef-type K+ transport system membrane component KefB